MNESASKEKDENNKQNNGISELDLNIDYLNEDQLLELAIKKSLEQENLEIERDKEAQLIQYAIYNSIKELNDKKDNKDNKDNNNNKDDESLMKIKEEKIEEEKFDENFGICPIKLEYMKHPVLTPSGNYYEKSAIIEWIKKNQTDPMTREKLTVDMLIEDKEYSKKIKEYKKKFKKEIRQKNK